MLRAALIVKPLKVALKVPLKVVLRATLIVTKPLSLKVTLKVSTPRLRARPSSRRSRRPVVPWVSLEFRVQGLRDFRVWGLRDWGFVEIVKGLGVLVCDRKV